MGDPNFDPAHGANTIVILINMLFFITRQLSFFSEQFRGVQTMTCKQLAQGCYGVSRVGVQPTTFELQCRTVSIEPRRPVGGSCRKLVALAN